MVTTSMEDMLALQSAYALAFLEVRKADTAVVLRTIVYYQIGLLRCACSAGRNRHSAPGEWHGCRYVVGAWGPGGCPGYKLRVRMSELELTPLRTSLGHRSFEVAKH